MGILDTIIDTKHTDLVHTFEPVLTVAKVLDSLKERDKIILNKRYGLAGSEQQTLETVGKELDLTRERVRQIEKSLLKQLKESIKELEHFQKSEELLKSTINEHGGIIAEADLLEHLGIRAIEEANAVRFILHLIEEVELIRGENHVKEAWASLSYNPELLNAFLDEAKSILESNGKPHKSHEFIEKFKQSSVYEKYAGSLSEKVIENFLKASRHIHKNSFGEFGLAHWNEINPRDVGDKAYVVLKHHNKPEHYSVITELINKHTAGRQAYKETVHNELIKDSRFILVGRGMYALAEWGYKPGVVSDVIAEVLKKRQTPMSRDEIVDEVLKHRMVKKNTILVGLSNKKLFKKVGKNLYELAQS